MSAIREPSPRDRRHVAGLTLVALTGLAAICVFARCSGGQPVTAELLAAARKTWNDAGLQDYDLEWTASGTTTAHYYVTVRRGSVRSIESVAPDGRRYEVHPAEPRYYSVDGLFTTIADELAQLKSERPFDQPKGTKVVMRFTSDPRLGFPRFYRRDVLGSSQGLAIDVIRLIQIDSKGNPQQAPRS